jgi:hypothetical protein
MRMIQDIFAMFLDSSLVQVIAVLGAALSVYIILSGIAKIIRAVEGEKIITYWTEPEDEDQGQKKKTVK